MLSEHLHQIQINRSRGWNLHLDLGGDRKREAFSSRQTAVLYILEAINEKGVDKIPAIKDKKLFYEYFEVSKSFINLRKEQLLGARPSDLVDEAICLIKKVDYLSRERYKNCQSERDLLTLMSKRALELRISKCFQIPQTRDNLEVAKTFRENYSITPSEINIILKNIKGENSNTTATTLEISAERKSLVLYKAMLKTGIIEATEDNDRP